MSSCDGSRNRDLIAEAVGKNRYHDLETPNTDIPMPAPPSAPSPLPEKSGSKMADSRDVDGAFEGSFAGTARDIAVIRPQPWYYRRQYYLDGWADPVIRRAAVSVIFPLLGLSVTDKRLLCSLLNVFLPHVQSTYPRNSA